MPTVNLPDGRKINFPDTMSAEEIQNALVGIRGTATEEAPAPETNLLEDVSQGLTGFTREAIAPFTLGVGGRVEEFGRFLAESIFGESGDPSIQKQREEFRTENPKLAITASIIGGLAGPIGQKAGGFIAKAQGLPQTIKRGAAVGAGLVGTQTAIESEGDIQERVVQTAEGAALGGTLGGTIPAAVTGVKAAGTGIVNLLSRFSDKRQGTMALRKVAEAMERDGFTPEQALQRIDELGPEAALLDVGPNSRALTFTAAGRPGKGKTRIAEMIRDRQEGVRDPRTGRLKGGQIARIENHINRLVPENFFDQRQQLANINESAALYKNAYAQNQFVESRVINRILKTPAGRQAMSNARTTLQNLQTNLSRIDPELTAQAKEAGIITGKGVGRGLKLEFLDQVKRELFDLETLAKTSIGKPTSRSRSISELRVNLTKELDNVDVTAQAGPGSLKIEGGDYARARLLAGDKLANQEALERGAEFMSKAKFGSPEELQIALNEMTPEMRHLFRVGAAQALKAKIGDTVSRADATKKLLDIPALEQKIQTAFGDQKLFANYTKFLENEKELFRAVTDVLSNSKTAERLLAAEDSLIDPGALLAGGQQVAGGQPIRGALNLAREGIRRLATGAKESEALAETLTGRNVQGLQNILPQVTPLTGQLAPRTLEETLIRGTTPTIQR